MLSAHQMSILSAPLCLSCACLYCVIFISLKTNNIYSPHQLVAKIFQSNLNPINPQSVTVQSVGLIHYPILSALDRHRTYVLSFYIPSPLHMEHSSIFLPPCLWSILPYSRFCITNVLFFYNP